MKRVLALVMIGFAACTGPSVEEEQNSVDRLERSSSQNALAAPIQTPPPAPVPVPLPASPDLPKGIYSVSFSLEKGLRVEQTIRFNPDRTFYLQERYNGKDSVVVTRGSWSPTNGYIWLYKDQIVRGRYKFSGDSLSYLNPATKKLLLAQKRPFILDNAVWKAKKGEGLRYFGIGTEPFWSIEVDKKDSIIFKMADWETPVVLKMDSLKRSGDTTYMISGRDSLEVKILPNFCSDGMSDHVYSSEVRVRYRNKDYQGCGVLYRR